MVCVYELIFSHFNSALDSFMLTEHTSNMEVSYDTDNYVVDVTSPHNDLYRVGCNVKICSLTHR